MMRYLNEAKQPDKKNPSSYVDQLADFIRKDKMPSDANYGSTLMRKPHEVPADASSGLKADQFPCQPLIQIYRTKGRYIFLFAQILHKINSKVPHISDDWTNRKSEEKSIYSLPFHNFP